MEIHEFLLVLFTILISARVLGELFAYLHLPSILGELVAGLILGPSLLGFIEVNDTLKLLAEIGILLLLFEIGLESDAKKLKSAGKYATTLALLGLIFPFVLAYLASYFLFDFSQLVSFFIAGTLTATSIGITLRVLKDVKQHTSFVAQTVIGAAVIDDILGVILLAFLYDVVTNETINMLHMFEVLVLITIFLVLAPLAATGLSKLIQLTRMRHRVPGFIPVLIVSLILLFGYIAHIFGAPGILGSFVAGIAFSRRFFLPLGSMLSLDKDFAHKVKQDMQPITHLFTPIFFVTVGLSVDLSVIDFTSTQFWITSLVIITVAFIGKYSASFFLFGIGKKDRHIMGISMIPRGEIGLIFAELGRISGILNNEVYAILIFVIIITTVIPPLIIKHYYSKRDNDNSTRIILWD
jgi:Kef-type K+ transport system membrane component KefB